ncbi:unnamed protein product [Chrysoparadoxa australica]
MQIGFTEPEAAALAMMDANDADETGGVRSLSGILLLLWQYVFGSLEDASAGGHDEVALSRIGVNETGGVPSLNVIPRHHEPDTDNLEAQAHVGAPDEAAIANTDANETDWARNLSGILWRELFSSPEDAAAGAPDETAIANTNAAHSFKDMPLHYVLGDSVYMWAAGAANPEERKRWNRRRGAGDDDGADMTCSLEEVVSGWLVILVQLVLLSLIQYAASLKPEPVIDSADDSAAGYPAWALAAAFLPLVAFASPDAAAIRLLTSYDLERSLKCILRCGVGLACVSMFIILLATSIAAVRAEVEGTNILKVILGMLAVLFITELDERVYSLLTRFVRHQRRRLQCTLGIIQLAPLMVFWTDPCSREKLPIYKITDWFIPPLAMWIVTLSVSSFVSRFAAAPQEEADNGQIIGSAAGQAALSSERRERIMAEGILWVLVLEEFVVFGILRPERWGEDLNHMALWWDWWVLYSASECVILVIWILYCMSRMERSKAVILSLLGAWLTLGQTCLWWRMTREASKRHRDDIWEGEISDIPYGVYDDVPYEIEDFPWWSWLLQGLTPLVAVIAFCCHQKWCASRRQHPADAMFGAAIALYFFDVWLWALEFCTPLLGKHSAYDERWRASRKQFRHGFTFAFFLLLCFWEIFQENRLTTWWNRSKFRKHLASSFYYVAHVTAWYWMLEVWIIILSGEEFCLHKKEASWSAQGESR